MKHSCYSSYQQNEQGNLIMWLCLQNISNIKESDPINPQRTISYSKYNKCNGSQVLFMYEYLDTFLLYQSTKQPYVYLDVFFIDQSVAFHFVLLSDYWCLVLCFQCLGAESQPLATTESAAGAHQLWDSGQKGATYQRDFLQIIIMVFLVIFCTYKG